MPASHRSHALCESLRDSHIPAVLTTERGITGETIRVDCDQLFPKARHPAKMLKACWVGLRPGSSIMPWLPKLDRIASLLSDR
jgi:hypothetical protein